MKNYNYYISAFLLFCIGFVNAQNAEIKRAAEKGKSDLMKILEQTKGQFDFGISAELIAESEPGEAIPYKEVNFERLLKYNERQTDDLFSKDIKMVVPLITGQEVVATVTALPNGTASELINHRYRHELNKLPREARGDHFSGVSIVYVPNLTAIVYLAGDMAYTSYNNREVSQGVPTNELMKELKVEAAKFQREFGDKLKEGRLLN